MQTAATNNRFLTDGPSKKMLAVLQTGNRHGEFYQQLAQSLIKGFHTKQALIELGQKLTALAHHAYTFRQMDNLEQASQILMNLPLAEYRNIGLYYYALAIKRRGQTIQAETLLERVADDAPVRYRGQALLSLGAFSFLSGSFNSALRFYTEALRVASKKDFLITVQTLKMVAATKGMDGDHRGAVADLEGLLPAVRAVSVYRPQFLCDYFNSLAVELGEVGRLEEAQNACRIVLASPYASAYPECHETWDDIQVRGYRTSRSVVAFTQKALNINNVVRLPERNVDADSDKSHRSPFHQQGSVTVLKAWKEEKMVKQPDDVPENNDKNNSQYTDKELVLKVMEVVASRNFSRGKMLEILDYLETTPDESSDSESS